LNSAEVARLAIEEALVASYRHVFGVMFWFVLLPGPTGAILYRLALSLKGRWGGKLGPEHGRFGTFALVAAKWIDWVPLRLTAMAFAVVGNFEDAVYCWRNQAGRWRDAETGIVLAAGAGAIGVKLGNPVREGFSSAGPALDERIEIGTGEDADAAFLSSTVGLVWRALVLWMLLLTMFEVATWVS
jgi:adenosylcobinamide-phosphate synthase